MGILNIIVHEVREKAKGFDGKPVVELKCRDEENVIDQHAEQLSSQLSSLFRKTGLNTGGFTGQEVDTDSEPHFVVLLRRFFNGGVFTDFVKFSSAAAKHFKKELEASSSSKGGYLLFNHYDYAGENFLSVVLLRKKNGLALSTDLTLAEIEEIDLDKLHMAARVNLSAWCNGTSKKYIAFRVGKAAKDVTDYFSDFIGCEEYTRARVDTRNLVEATKVFCTQNGLSDEKSEDVKSFVYEQCISWLENGVGVHLDELSSLLDARYSLENKGVFLEIAQNEPFSLSNELPIEKSALRGLTRYSGRGQKISISFDSDLLNVSVFYDGESEIRITDIPSSLKEQLKETKLR